MDGVVFDIKEFSVFDGPGVRVTVFLKGCPLRCKWCHNPEGLRPEPQVMVSSACMSCGGCYVSDCAMKLNGRCNGCGRCISLCPNAFRSISGKVWSSRELADRIMSYAPFFTPEGRVTFSGGEPTMQSDFLCEVMERLPIHKAIQTCGFCPEKDFARVLELTDFLFFDIKHADPVKHKEYTGVDNALILKNLERVKRSGKPFIARVPLIEGVNDSEQNLTATAELLSDAGSLIRVELLPYNSAAGAKYKMTGQAYPYEFKAPEHVDLKPFERLEIPVLLR